MARLVALLVFIVAFSAVYAYSSHPHCARNEEWADCGKPAECEQRCGSDPPKICPTICVARCQCKKGYLRNFNNDCVLSQNCFIKY